MSIPKLPPLKASTCARNSQKSEPVVRSYTAKSVKAREHALLSRIAQLEHMWREAEDRALCAEEAAMSHAARIIEMVGTGADGGEERMSARIKLSRENAELPPLPSKSPDWDAIDAYAEVAAERERILLARVAELEAALDAVIIRSACTSWGVGYDIWKIASAARGAK